MVSYARRDGKYHDRIWVCPQGDAAGAGNEFADAGLGNTAREIEYGHAADARARLRQCINVNASMQQRQYINRAAA
jgi:hypothetical protein